MIEAIGVCRPYECFSTANIHINPHSAIFLIGIFFHNSILFAYVFVLFVQLIFCL